MEIEGNALGADFFDRDAQQVARDTLGKVLCHKARGGWLAAQIIETEAYYTEEKASHASLGFTEKRRALFMTPGSIYMYFARGGDSFNVSCRGGGNAVLFKSGIPFTGDERNQAAVARMTRLNPLPSGKLRLPERLCSGQTLLCRSLGLKVTEWDRRSIQEARIALLDVGYRPEKIIRTTRLGIPPGRDGHLPFRYIDFSQAAHCTRNPLTRRKGGGPAYEIITGDR